MREEEDKGGGSQERRGTRRKEEGVKGGGQARRTREEDKGGKQGRSRRSGFDWCTYVSLSCDVHVVRLLRDASFHHLFSIQLVLQGRKWDGECSNKQIKKGVVGVNAKKGKDKC